VIGRATAPAQTPATTSCDAGLTARAPPRRSDPRRWTGLPVSEPERFERSGTRSLWGPKTPASLFFQDEALPCACRDRSYTTTRFVLANEKGATRSHRRQLPTPRVRRPARPCGISFAWIRSAIPTASRLSSRASSDRRYSALAVPRGERRHELPDERQIALRGRPPPHLLSITPAHGVLVTLERPARAPPHPPRSSVPLRDTPLHHAPQRGVSIVGSRDSILRHSFIRQGHSSAAYTPQ